MLNTIQKNLTLMPQFADSGEADCLVERITSEVLKGVEAYLDKKIDLVMKKLEECSSKVAALDTRTTVAEGRISEWEDALKTYTAKFTEVESKLEAALKKIDDLENRGRRCNICIVVLFLQNLVV